MIDLHCHLLPSLDDGAQDLQDAIGMARQAEADGIDGVCATPHIREDHDVALPELDRRRRALQEALDRAGCPTRVLPGGEVAATVLDRLSDRELSSLSLGGGGRWILLEPPAGPLGASFEAAVHRLHLRGFRALVAHPERHPTEDLIGRLRRLIADGALVQITADFLLQAGIRDAMLELAAARVVHVLGSDAHSSRAGRPVALRRAIESLAGVAALAAHLEWIAEQAPAAIVAGEDVTPPF